MKAVDLFAGCGGMSLGFQNAGFNIVAAFEFWDIAAECYEKNFSHPVFRTDLSDVDLAVKQISTFSPFASFICIKFFSRSICLK